MEKLQPVIEKLKEECITPDPIVDKLPVPGLCICFLRDPEGNIVELMENWPPSA